MPFVDLFAAKIQPVRAMFAAAPGAFVAVLVMTVAVAVMGPANAVASSALGSKQAQYQPATGAIFNNPWGSEAEQRRLFTQVINAANAAPKGSTIRVAVFTFADPAISQALIAAYRRGVHVRVVTAGGREFPPFVNIRRVLGGNADAKSFAVMCEKSCRGTRGQMHAKYFAFQKSGGSQWVTMVGSNNLSKANSRLWNDLYVVAGDKSYYKALASWFKELKEDTPVANPYLRIPLGERRLSITPITAATPDPMLGAMSDLQCTGKRPGRVRIATYAWNGERGIQVARRVAELQRTGCRVQVFYGEGMGGTVMAILRNNDVELLTHGKGTHQKMVVLRDTFGEKKRSTRALTGSQNWSSKALGRDDVIVETTEPQAAQQYIAGFRGMWRAALDAIEASEPGGRR